MKLSNFTAQAVADPGGFEVSIETPFWNSYTLIEQSDWDALITVVLLEIIQ